MPRLGSKVLKAHSKPNMTQRDGYEFTDANRAQQQGALWRGAIMVTKRASDATLTR